MSLRVCLVDCEGDDTIDGEGEVCAEGIDEGPGSSLVSCLVSF